MILSESINEAVLNVVPPQTRALLDLGCGGGAMDARIKERFGCSVVGVTFSEEEAVAARARLDRVEVHDLNTLDPAALGKFDCILCCHVLEHLYQPDEILRRIRGNLLSGGTLVVALPNVLFWNQRLRFLRGHFRYTDGWLMDRTHFRFFDQHTARELLTEAGYIVEHAFADGAVPYTKVLGRSLQKRVNAWGLRHFPGLFGWQFVFRCHLPEQLSA